MTPDPKQARTPSGTRRGGAEPVVGALEEVWSSLLDATSGLSPGEWDRSTDCPGWSVRDQLSHLIGIERSLLGERPPEPRRAPHVNNDIGAMNEGWVEERRGRPGDEVRAELREVTGRRLEALAGTTEEAWDRVGWSPIGQVPYRRFMWLRVMDSWVHEQDVRSALGRPGGVGGAGEAETLRHVTSLLPYVIGRKVAPEEGITVAFTLEGDLPDGQESAVGVRMSDGRGKAVDPAGGADTSLKMDPSTYWRLGCGRLAPEQATVELGGDEALGRRVLEQMNFMI